MDNTNTANQTQTPPAQSSDPSEPESNPTPRPQTRAHGTSQAHNLSALANDSQYAADGHTSFSCPNLDVVVHHLVAQDMLQTLAEVLVKQRISLDSKDGVQKLRTQVEEAINNLGPMPPLGDPQADPNAAQDVLSHVRTALTNFVKSRPRGLMGFVTSLAVTAASKSEDVERTAQRLLECGAWPNRAAFARTTILRLDSRANDHCTHRFGSAQELLSHQESECSFRTLLCENKGCNKSFAARSREQHDQICPYKLVECPQKCGLSLPRKDTERHCATDCGMRVIPCPFKEIGCHDEIAQMLMNEHLNDFAHAHLLYCMKTITTTNAAVRDLSTVTTALQAEITANTAIQAQLVQQVKELEKHHKSNDKEMSKLKKVAQEMERSLKTMQGLSKQLESRLKQMESDVYEN